MAKRTKIHLASNLSFSTDVITEVINVIAKRGSGKTYTGTKIAEEMLAVGLTHTSGTFGTYLSSLTSNNLAVRESGYHTISPDLLA